MTRGDFEDAIDFVFCVTGAVLAICCTVISVILVVCLLKSLPW